MHGNGQSKLAFTQRRRRVEDAVVRSGVEAIKCRLRPCI